MEISGSDTMTMINEVWQEKTDPYPQTVRQSIKTSALFREETFDFLLTHDLRIYMHPTDSISEIPRTLWVINLCKVELLEILRLEREGAHGLARQKLERLLRVGDRLASSGSLISLLVSYAISDMTCEVLPELYPLKGNTENSGAIQFIEILAGSDRKCIEDMDRAYTVEAVSVTQSILHAEDEYDIDFGGYPFGNEILMQESIEDEYARLIGLNNSEYRISRHRLGSYPHEDQPLGSMILRPVNAFWLTIAIPKLATSISKRVVMQGTLRLATLQLYLALYKKENGRLPETLAELYEHFGIEPIINPYNSEEYPYPEIIVDDKVDFNYTRDQIEANEVHEHRKN